MMSIDESVKKYFNDNYFFKKERHFLYCVLSVAVSLFSCGCGSCSRETTKKSEATLEEKTEMDNEENSKPKVENIENEVDYERDDPSWKEFCRVRQCYSSEEREKNKTLRQQSIFCGPLHRGNCLIYPEAQVKNVDTNGIKVE